MQDAFATPIDARLANVFERIFRSKLTFQRNLMRVDAKPWDSLKHVELMVAVEIEFGIRMDGADATEIDGVPRLIEIVGAKLS